MRISAARARELFVASRVARLATADASGVPHLVPVTFACLTEGDADVLVFAVDHKPKTTAGLRRLANIEANPAVSFLVDEYDDDWSRLWWVRADGRATVVDRAMQDRAPAALQDRAPAALQDQAPVALRERALAALRDRYEQYRERPPTGPVVAARVTRWSGWAAVDLSP